MAVTQSEPDVMAPSKRRELLNGIADALGRFSPLLAGASIFALSVALVGLFTGGVLSVLLWRWQSPGEFSEYVQVAVLVAVLLAPAIILGLFAFALHEVAELPDRLRNLPENARRHSSDLGQIARDMRGIGERQRGRTSSLFGLGKLLYNARDDLLVYLPLLELANPIFLLAVLVSFVAVGVQVMVLAGVSAAMLS